MRSFLVALFLTIAFPAIAAECPDAHKVAVIEADAMSKGASQIRWFRDGAEYDAFRKVLGQLEFVFEERTNRMGASFFNDVVFIIEAHDECFLMGTPIPRDVFRQVILQFEREATRL